MPGESGEGPHGRALPDRAVSNRMGQFAATRSTGYLDKHASARDANQRGDICAFNGQFGMKISPLALYPTTGSTVI